MWKGLCSNTCSFSRHACLKTWPSVTHLQHFISQVGSVLVILMRNHRFCLVSHTLSYFMDGAGGPYNFYAWWVHIGMDNNQAENSGRHPLTSSGTDDKNTVSMSKCVHLCQLIYWRCYPTLPAPAIKAQHFHSTLMPLMLFNHSSIHHSMS